MKDSIVYDWVLKTKRKMFDDANDISNFIYDNDLEGTELEKANEDIKDSLCRIANYVSNMESKQVRDKMDKLKKDLLLYANIEYTERVHQLNISTDISSLDIIDANNYYEALCWLKDFFNSDEYENVKYMEYLKDKCNGRPLEYMVNLYDNSEGNDMEEMLDNLIISDFNNNQKENK